eukprot:m.252871 g.252871  ORF g.252871 m.252871 type:complete len:187 (-) comp18005_c0_seq1:33-593(-)
MAATPLKFVMGAHINKECAVNLSRLVTTPIEPSCPYIATTIGTDYPGVASPVRITCTRGGTILATGDDERSAWSAAQAAAIIVTDNAPQPLAREPTIVNVTGMVRFARKVNTACLPPLRPRPRARKNKKRLFAGVVNLSVPGIRSSTCGITKGGTCGIITGAKSVDDLNVLAACAVECITASNAFV